MFVRLLLLRLTSTKGGSISVVDFGDRCLFGGTVLIVVSSPSSEMTKSDATDWDDRSESCFALKGELVLLGPAT